MVAPRPSIRRSDHLGIVHEPRSPIAPHKTELDGIPLTTPARTLFDLTTLPRVPANRLERLVDAALSSDLTTVSRFERTLEQLATRGRRGIVVMRELIAERAAGLRPTESGLEFRFHELAQRACVHGFERQVDLGDGDDWIGRADFVHHGLRLIVECDTALHHGSLSDQRRDSERRDRYRAEGWHVEVVTDVEVSHRSDDVVNCLQLLLRQARSTQLAC